MANDNFNAAINQHFRDAQGVRVEGLEPDPVHAKMNAWIRDGLQQTQLVADQDPDEGQEDPR